MYPTQRVEEIRPLINASCYISSCTHLGMWHSIDERCCKDWGHIAHECCLTRTPLHSVASLAALFSLVQSCETAILYNVMASRHSSKRSCLLSAFAEALCIVVAFDESLNEVTKKERIDVLCGYWDLTVASARTRYQTSFPRPHLFWRRDTCLHERLGGRNTKMLQVLWMDQMWTSGFIGPLKITM